MIRSSCHISASLSSHIFRNPEKGQMLSSTPERGGSEGIRYAAETGRIVGEALKKEYDLKREIGGAKLAKTATNADIALEMNVEPQEKGVINDLGSIPLGGKTFLNQEFSEDQLQTLNPEYVYGKSNPEGWYYLKAYVGGVPYLMRIKPGSQIAAKYLTGEEWNMLNQDPKSDTFKNTLKVMENPGRFSSGFSNVEVGRTIDDDKFTWSDIEGRYEFQHARDRLVILGIMEKEAPEAKKAKEAALEKNPLLRKHANAMMDAINAEKDGRSLEAAQDAMKAKFTYEGKAFLLTIEDLSFGRWGIKLHTGDGKEEITSFNDPRKFDTTDNARLVRAALDQYVFTSATVPDTYRFDVIGIEGWKFDWDVRILDKNLHAIKPLRYLGRDIASRHDYYLVEAPGVKGEETKVCVMRFNPADASEAVALMVLEDADLKKADLESNDPVKTHHKILEGKESFKTVKVFKGAWYKKSPEFTFDDLRKTEVYEKVIKKTIIEALNKK